MDTSENDQTAKIFPLSPTVLAEILDVHSETIYRALASGKLTSARMNEKGAHRIFRTDVEAYLGEQRTFEIFGAREE